MRPLRKLAPSGKRLSSPEGSPSDVSGILLATEELHFADNEKAAATPGGGEGHRLALKDSGRRKSLSEAYTGVSNILICPKEKMLRRSAMSSSKLIIRA